MNEINNINKIDSTKTNSPKNRTKNLSPCPDSVVSFSPAKINLSLDIIHKREDGYHEIASIMQQISLKDRLTFKKSDHGISISCNSPQVPVDIHNLAYKAWEKLELYTGRKLGVDIHIEKTIPVGAGLAGGSSNAASTLLALNDLWQLGLSTDQLMKLGKSIGADVPFCILGGTALARGIGEDLTPLEPFRDVDILICNPGFEISTRHAYDSLNLNSGRIDQAKLLQAIKRRDLETIAKNMQNKMEAAIVEEYPIIDEIKKLMIENGACGSLMSGSGPTVFGIFEDSQKIALAGEKLKKRFPKTYICKTI